MMEPRRVWLAGVDGPVTFHAVVTGFRALQSHVFALLTQQGLFIIFYLCNQDED